MSDVVRNLVKSRAVGPASLQFTEKGVRRAKKIGAAVRKSVLLAMADRANDRGASVFQAMSTLADESGYTRRGVQQAVATLKADGLIRPVAKRPCRGGYLYEYEIDLGQVAALAFTPSSLEAKQRKSPSEVVNPVHTRGEPGSHPLVNPVHTRHPLKHPRDIHSAENEVTHSDVEKCVRESSYLDDDADFQRWVADMEARDHG